VDRFSVMTPVMCLYEPFLILTVAPMRSRSSLPYVSFFLASPAFAVSAARTSFASSTATDVPNLCITLSSKPLLALPPELLCSIVFSFSFSSSSVSPSPTRSITLSASQFLFILVSSPPQLAYFKTSNLFAWNDLVIFGLSVVYQSPMIAMTTLPTVPM